MKELINGNQLQRLLNKKESNLREKYEIETIDIRLLNSLKRGLDVNMLEDLVEMGVFGDKEIADSLLRLHKQGIIEMVRADGDIHAVAFKLTRVGAELWNKLKEDYEYANKIMFKGMTEEQIETFKRLSEIVVQNIDKELKR